MSENHPMTIPRRQSAVLLFVAALFVGCEEGAAGRNDPRLLPAPFQGRVVAVQDGDSLTVRRDRGGEFRIRLEGIDAPEAGQPYGRASGRELRRLLFRRTVSVEPRKIDQYGRIVAVVTIDGIDAGLEQIRSGHAWHYLAYAGEQKPAERAAYAAAEAEARASRRGIWSERNPQAPWEWRRERRGVAPVG
jgi:endonuclease YncB( thermonuclease family)